MENEDDKEGVRERGREYGVDWEMREREREGETEVEDEGRVRRRVDVAEERLEGESGCEGGERKGRGCLGRARMRVELRRLLCDEGRVLFRTKEKIGKTQLDLERGKEVTS